MSIDWDQVVTPEAIAAEVAAARLAAAKAECRRRILSVANETAQMNIFGAAVTGLLPEEDMATAAAGVGWVAVMRAACATAAASEDVTDDAHWPAIPPGVAELAGRF
jgi:hypothetical protein